jgi:hypothetical protein
MTNAIKVLLQMTSVSLQPVPSLENTSISIMNNKINTYLGCKQSIAFYRAVFR